MEAYLEACKNKSRLLALINDELSAETPFIQDLCQFKCKIHQIGQKFSKFHSIWNKQWLNPKS